MAGQLIALCGHIQNDRDTIVTAKSHRTRSRLPSSGSPEALAVQSDVLGNAE